MVDVSRPILVSLCLPKHKQEREKKHKIKKTANTLKNKHKKHNQENIPREYKVGAESELSFTSTAHEVVSCSPVCILHAV